MNDTTTERPRRRGRATAVAATAAAMTLLGALSPVVATASADDSPAPYRPLRTDPYPRSESMVTPSGTSVTVTQWGESFRHIHTVEGDLPAFGPSKPIDHRDGHFTLQGKVEASGPTADKEEIVVTQGMQVGCRVVTGKASAAVKVQATGAAQGDGDMLEAEHVDPASGKHVPAKEPGTIGTDVTLPNVEFEGQLAPGRTNTFAFFSMKAHEGASTFGTPKAVLHMEGCVGQASLRSYTRVTASGPEGKSTTTVWGSPFWI